MARTLFRGQLTSAGPRVWRIDSSGRYLLSGPAKEGATRPAYAWGDDSDHCLDLAMDLLYSIGTPADLACELAPELVLGVLCALPDNWELTGGQLALWRDTVPQFAPSILRPYF